MGFIFGLLVGFVGTAIAAHYKPEFFNKEVGDALAYVKKQTENITK